MVFWVKFVRGSAHTLKSVAMVSLFLAMSMGVSFAAEAQNTAPFTPQTEPEAGPTSARVKLTPSVRYLEMFGPTLPPEIERPALFGSAEFSVQDPKIFVKWNAMKTRFYTQLSEGRLPAKMRSLMHHMRRLKNAPLSQKVYMANMLVNRMDYVRDVDNWGKSDYWATPVEFFARGSGDCEDFAIAKYSFLRALGVPDDRMRLAIVHDRVKRIPHAVLVVYTERGALVLDNQERRVMSSKVVRRYRPLLSLNNTGGWLHKI